MSEGWTLVPLGEVLRKSEECVPIDPDATYTQVTVRLWGQGVVPRNIVTGAEIASATRFVARPQQFILSRIDARNGAFGLVPESLDGAVVSNDFPLFDVDAQRLLPSFLSWMSKTPAFVNLCKAASEGTTNRVRLKEDRFLATAVPLPPLPEQRRIVARIEALAGKIERARELGRGLASDCAALCRSLLKDGSHGSPTPTRMGELVTLRETDVEVVEEEKYHFAGVYCFGEGVFRGQERSGMEFAYTRLTRLCANNFVYPKLMAWEGAFGIVPPECDGLVVSPEFPVFEVNEGKVLPEVLDVYFRTPAVWPRISAVSTGTNVRRRRLHPAAFLAYEFPLPPMAAQLQFREVKQRVDVIEQLQAQTAAELNALLPSILDRAFRGEL